MKKDLLDFINNKALLFAFFVPFVVRLIPEILMGPYVVGFDTLSYYVPNTLNWLHSGIASLSSFLNFSPFLYLILMASTSTGIPIVLSLKFISPLLLGLLGLAVYYYANRTLTWSSKKSLFVAMVATLYFVALRISWDMLRSELALIFLFITLAFLEKSGNPRKNVVVLTLAMFSVVFAHQLVAAIMFAIIIATITRLTLARKVPQLLRIVICSLPALVLFSIIIFLSSNSVIAVFPNQGTEGFFALFGFSNYSAMIVDTLGFLVFCYLPLMPIIILGAKKFRINQQLNAWIVWIAIMVLIVVISPNAFLAVLPYRWVLLLVYPLAFFAVEGFSKITRNAYKWGIGLMLITLSIGFIALPNNLALPYYTLYNNYVPASMLQNSVSLNDSQNVANALQWVNNNMPSNGNLLVHDVFLGWASLSVDANRLVLYGYNTPDVVAKQQSSSNQLYLIWWINGSGWHGQPTVSSSFTMVYQSGDIAVYNYTDNTSA